MAWLRWRAVLATITQDREVASFGGLRDLDLDFISMYFQNQESHTELTWLEKLQRLFFIHRKYFSYCMEHCKTYDNLEIYSGRYSCIPPRLRQIRRIGRDQRLNNSHIMYSHQCICRCPSHDSKRVLDPEVSENYWTPDHTRVFLYTQNIDDSLGYRRGRE